MKVDYSKATLKELNEIIADAVAARNKIISTRRSQLLAELNELDKLSKAGLGKTAREVPSSKAIYRDDKGNSWRGRGRMPQWLKDEVDGGAKLEDFEVHEAKDD
ncbi:H-NS family nucleoid-associated regulatory protein [Rhizobium sp. NPDC090279]|uniref:H-NS histone family protein n=1 Tax=Rhizobium sp. NPDC090279 TaxID=3364499 RepID=UPI00383B02FF